MYAIYTDMHVLYYRGVGIFGWFVIVGVWLGGGSWSRE